MTIQPGSTLSKVWTLAIPAQNALGFIFVLIFVSIFVLVFMKRKETIRNEST